MIDLNNLGQYRENNRIEAKKAIGGLPHSIWETYSAFANTLGGLILLGVEEHADKSLHAVDLPDPEKLVKEFWDAVNNPNKASVNILSNRHVRIENAEGKRIVVIDVPRAQRYYKPVYVDGNPVSGTYRRNGEGDYHCSDEELHAIVPKIAEEDVDELTRLLAKQLEQGKMQVKKDTPVFTVVQPITVPTKASNSRAKTLIVWTFFGGILGCGIVLGRGYWPKLKEQFASK